MSPVHSLLSLPLFRQSHHHAESFTPCTNEPIQRSIRRKKWEEANFDFVNYSNYARYFAQFLSDLTQFEAHPKEISVRWFHNCEFSRLFRDFSFHQLGISYSQLLHIMFSTEAERERQRRQSFCGDCSIYQWHHWPNPGVLESALSHRWPIIQPTQIITTFLIDYFPITLKKFDFRPHNQSWKPDYIQGILYREYVWSIPWVSHQSITRIARWVTLSQDSNWGVEILCFMTNLDNHWIENWKKKWSEIKLQFPENHQKSIEKPRLKERKEKEEKNGNGEKKTWVTGIEPVVSKLNIFTLNRYKIYSFKVECRFSIPNLILTNSYSMIYNFWISSGKFGKNAFIFV
jgi:hypothetical protein